MQRFLTRRFLNFSIHIYRENKLRTLAVMFLTNHHGLNNHGRWSPRKHFCHVILKSVQWFLTRRVFFLSFLYRYEYIGKISPVPWRPGFLTNHNGLNNLGRELPKDHFCKIILKSVRWFLTRKFLKVYANFNVFVAMATRVLLGFQIFEQLSVSTSQVSFW